MAEYLTPLSDAEQDVMQVVWERGPSLVRQVRDGLSARGRVWAYTTTKTVLDRLEAKGYLLRDRTEPSHVYHPKVTREELVRQRVTAMREVLFDGSGAPLIRALVEGGLTSEEIAELRTSLDDLERVDER